MSLSTALKRWPVGVGLAALVSGDFGGPWSRWSVLASPAGSVIGRSDGLGGVAWERIGDLPETTPPLCDMWHLRRVKVSSEHAPNAADRAPFVGGWIGGVAYEMGAVIEPASIPAPAARASAGDVLAVWHWCPAAYVHDGLRGIWWRVGGVDAERWLPRLDVAGEASARVRIGALRSATGRAAYEGAAARAVEYVHAGDVFQANISHRVRAKFGGSARELFARLLRDARPWYGAYLEVPGCAVVSASPELLVQLDGATREVVTRPIKGTRAAADARLLLESGKDGAELAMIVDLMRNDLGRVCRYGSIRVEEARGLERHGGGRVLGIAHTVATVRGVLREGVGIDELLRATFPGGSITGAPKVRAMQVIGELEGRPRGFYTGSIGYVSECGNTAFNIAIRTFEIRGENMNGRPGEFACATLEYGVGAGIVAESSPAAEWRETVQKAGVVRTQAARARPKRGTGP